MSAGVVPDGRINSLQNTTAPTLVFVVFLLFEALAGAGLTQGKQPPPQTRKFQFHTKSSAGVGL
jgi:hypothetical protein